MKNEHMCFPGIVALAGVLALCACTAKPAPAANRGEKVLRVVPSSDLEILDPILSSAEITRSHGYMIYDTLFGMDASGKIMPQMVDIYKSSKDGKTWTFTLRDGLEFHDGMAVTSGDVIASLRRWGQRDTMGQKLFSFMESLEPLNSKTFQMKLKEPYGLVLESLGKPSSYVPFIMPKRVAETPFDKQIDDTTGSGPFVYKKEESKPGEKVAYFRNTKYKPRADPPSGTAGGKVVKVDHVQWVIIKDAQTAANALAAGEVDMIESPAFAQYSSLQSDSSIQMVETNLLGSRFLLRFNHLQPPFDNVKVRQAAMAALNQPDFLLTQVGIPEIYRSCFSIYPCNTAYATTKGMDTIAKPDLNHARQLLKESGYDGKPVILLQQSDVAIEAKLPEVAKQLLTQAGFNIEMQLMDRETLASRRARKDGWNIFLYGSASIAYIGPFSSNLFSGACAKAWFGWPCDMALEKLRNAFALAGDETERKSLAEQIQVRAMEIGALVPLGEYSVKVAARKNLTGFVTGFFTVYWNVEKQ